MPSPHRLTHPRGDEVIFHGASFDEARLHCERLARDEGARYIHSGDEPLLIAGVGTETLEMLEDETLAESAGAASLAAAYRLHERLAGRTLGIICSGGNTSLDHLRRALASWPTRSPGGA